MITKPTKLTTSAALAAALSMIATPAAAAELPYVGLSHVGSSDVEVQTGEAETQFNQRRYRGRRYRNRGVDAGDVVAGVLVLGAIAAIVGSGRSRDRNRTRERDRDYRERDDRRDRTTSESRGLENATSICVEQVQRGSERVEDISSARRTTDGWRVAGTLTSGEGWNCWIDNDGRIRSVDFGASEFSSDASGDQWNDDAYARARSGTRTAANGEYVYREEPQTASIDDGAQPAYPGGPLPGEEGYDDAADADGRYTTAQASDFPQRDN